MGNRCLQNLQIEIGVILVHFLCMQFWDGILCGNMENLHRIYMAGEFLICPDKVLFSPNHV